MGWFLGAATGMFLGGPLGAIAGGVLQHMATKTMTEIGPSSSKAEVIFVSNLTAIITKVAMADGEVSRIERVTIHQFFESTLGYRGSNLEFIDRLMEETILQDPPLEPICSEFLRYSNPENRMLLLNILYQVAFTDHTITHTEQDTIDKIASLLQVPDDINLKIKNTYTYAQSRSRQSSGNRSQSRTRNTSSNTHYSVLGLERSASDSEVKKAYRALAMQYHPDKVAHLGEELVDFAKKKFTTINTSYEAIKKERGIN